MSFIKKKMKIKPMEDTVFSVVKEANHAKSVFGKENVIDATIGSLTDENGDLVAYETVYQVYNTLSNKEKAKYASSFLGNESYRNAVFQWVFSSLQMNLYHSVIATPGGTGAINLMIEECLDENEILLLPEIGWSSYWLMAEMANVKVQTYRLFNQQKFDIQDFQKQCEEIIKTQNKLVVILNDPCHNPTGYSLTIEEWQQIVNYLNSISTDIPILLLNDIAYIDYTYREDGNQYMNLWNQFHSNVMVMVTFSCSKALTSYGMRCGSIILLSKSKRDVEEVEMVFEKAARAKWSNISNSAMLNFVKVVEQNKKEYLEEKNQYIKLLKQRSEAFLNEAKKYHLPLYPYKEGFFITLQIEDEQRDWLHEQLMKQHIYTIKVNKGLRIAICSLSVKQCHILPQKIHTALTTMNC